MILTATWIGTGQLNESPMGEKEERIDLLTFLIFAAFDLLMASMVFTPEVWL